LRVDGAVVDAIQAPSSVPQSGQRRTFNAMASNGQLLRNRCCWNKAVEGLKNRLTVCLNANTKGKCSLSFPSPLRKVSARQSRTWLKLKVVLRQNSLCATCGERLGKLEDTQFDHVPALQLRCWDPEAKNTIPPANDVDTIFAKTHRLPCCQDLRVEGLEARR